MNNVININSFEDIFSEGIDDALYYMELPSGVYKYITKSSTVIYGYSPQEFYSEPLLIKKIIHPDFLDYFNDKWEKLLNGKMDSHYEYKIITKDNKVKWINQRNSLEKDEEDNIIGIKGIITDITYIKSIEEDLENNRKRFEEISLISSDWVWEVDNNGIYTFVSDRVEEILGYTADEMMGKSPFDFMPSEEADRVLKIFNEYSSEEKSFKDLKNTNIHKNGQFVILQTSGFPIFDNKGKFIGYRGTDKDITDINNLVTNLNEAQELAQIGHWELDLITSELYWSDEVYRIFGLEIQEFDATYEAFLNHIHPDDHDLVNEAYSTSLENKSSYSIRHRVLTKDNQLKYVEERCIHKLDNVGNVIKSIGTVHDITKQVESEKELNIAANVYRHSNDAILITDKDNNIISINKAHERITGYRADEVIGENPRIFSSGWGDKQFYKNMWDSLAKNDFWEEELWDRRKDGTLYAISMSIVCIRDKEANIINYIAISRDITESKNKEKAIHQLAYYDFLTKLPNRKLFQEEVESFIKSSHFNDEKFAILFLDLDNFKWVNDSLGHFIGDKVLVKVSELLSNLVDKDSIVSRIGGDEFVLIVPFDKKFTISRLATNILKTVVDPIKIDNNEINVGWSIGISIYPDNAQSYSDLLKTADTAMYIAKENGKNNFRYFNDEMNQEAVERLDLDTRIRQAMRSNDFTLNYQPKASCKTQSIEGVEALIRWNEAELGFIPPDKFIPIAEESGYMNEIGTWVMKQALSDLKIIHEKQKQNITMAINISGKQLDENSFYYTTKQIIEESGVDPKFIEFEITETAIMQDIENVIVVLEKIKGLGISISIDDFGTGYSSLSYLRKLPIDILKIDKEFVMEIEDDYESNGIVEATIALSTALKLKTIAEGVETINQKNILAKLGCNLMQGYLYSKPLGLNTLLEFMSKNK